MADASPSTSPSTSSTNDAHNFKVVLCGKKGVGKTALYNRLKDDKFYDEESMTVTSDQCFLTLPHGSNTEVKVNIWDTAGLETFDSLTRSYFHKCFFIVIVYSADIESSLSVVADCVSQAKQNAPGSAKLVLVQNKIDLPESPQKSGFEFSKADFKFEFKASAKTGQGTKEMMKKLVTYYCKHSKKRDKKCSRNIRVGAGDGRASWLSRCCSRK